MTVEHQVAQHYAHGTLERTILDALKATGLDPDHLTLADLAPIDEFHIGGRQATVDFAGEFSPQQGAHLLDIGCGLGGASRYFADKYGCQVTGIDLTDDYVRAAAMLSRRLDFDNSVSYRQASALALPFSDATIDGAYMLHVGMNIPDKQKLFIEVRRVLKSSATFGIYDVMRENNGAFSYPVPWSSAPETNFIDTAENYQRLLVAAGFAVQKTRSRREFAIEFFRQMRERMALGTPSPLGLQILMGATTQQKVANMIGLLERGVISPTEIIAQAA